MFSTIMFLGASLKAFEWFLRMMFSRPPKENSQKCVPRKFPDGRPETGVSRPFFWGGGFDFATSCIISLWFALGFYHASKKWGYQMRNARTRSMANGIALNWRNPRSELCDYYVCLKPYMYTVVNKEYLSQTHDLGVHPLGSKTFSDKKNHAECAYLELS